jgi:hypothetical protein
MINTKRNREDWIALAKRVPAEERVSWCIDQIMELQGDLMFARRATALFNSMILSGEQHSKTSLDTLEKAMGIKQ